jgi:hypothetical protein
MKKQKLISAVLVVVFVLSLTPTVSASEYIAIAPLYLYTNTMTINLVIIGNTATCQTVVTGLSSVTRIEATHYLQRWNGSSWVTVTNATWSDSVNGRRLSMTNQRSGLGNGTYRVYAVARVFAGSNFETVPGWSNSVTI